MRLILFCMFSCCILPCANFPFRGLLLLLFSIRVKRRQRKSILRRCSVEKLQSHSREELQPVKEHEHAVSKSEERKKDMAKARKEEKKAGDSEDVLPGIPPVPSSNHPKSDI